ncbi:hypothetical protein [Streptacidiphilus monticola]|uniref:Tetratricopeptide repeat protein n=1 Tax=Streptacidiphilus monticola TaxID=2161674 RepID=A0ABW1FYF3_9ACTN
MAARITYIVVSAALLLGFVVVVATGAQLMATGNGLGIGMGIAAEVLVGLGLWFLWKTYRFGRNSARLARELEAEGGLPTDRPERSAGGRVDRDQADAVFAKRQAEAEAEPDDWRVWFRLAVAYADARDTPRARKAMEHAIKLHGRGAGTGAPAA